MWQLSDWEASVIKRLYRERKTTEISHLQIAEAFGISRQHVWQVAKNYHKTVKPYGQEEYGEAVYPVRRGYP